MIPAAAVDHGSWVQLADLGVALVLTAVIGLERELRAKSAGLRTHTLVGVGAALFVLVSKYGFTDVLAASHVSLDPSRVAAGIVTGIGFIGGGLIFVRGDAVRGLTTAATVWVAAAVGATAGAGLWVLAAVATVAHLVVVYGIMYLSRMLPSSGSAASSIDLVYHTGAGTLAEVLQAVTRRGFRVARVSVEPPRRGRAGTDAGDAVPAGEDVRRVRFVLTGVQSLADLAVTLEGIAGVLAVSAEDANADVE
ncbi:MAG: MgtC/SapB family protein [Nocardioidaceae bacterium]